MSKKPMRNGADDNIQGDTAQTANLPGGWAWPIISRCPASLLSVVSNLDQSRTYVYKGVDGLSYDNLWKRPAEKIYSIGNILMHLRGTEHQWIGNRIGHLPLLRDRESEFNTRQGKNTADLVADLRQVHAQTQDVIAKLTSADLNRCDYGGKYTVEFIIHYITQHFAYHAGQIPILRALADADFELNQ
ncbi:MAG: DUF664 domain-containing protein [Planctomycetes bacterium]|nr:DUF664 domain-containing protein [Planctomycetota bacterium]